ncbi:uncharacterized protein EKO05_0001595 [Ascochyta rabiei]|uniref:Uncharacterized protein n=1 Tax=Didymella rabiei TaxID=5454 RepID=A0A163M6G5_DIDRA|nr:uncharacterized protein EKO05_0001595 [Ascochyta rabiei]KZM28442.1 hypothetical protein ST47_g422 [Ascochyta rabiei]UPX10965.1 hypothetical protein EKO05_0001595 [Ascochyta rabiei]
MPRFLQPKKSTQHRVAAIALYRALLSGCSSAALPDDDRTSLRNAIQNKFRQNRKLQSPYQLRLSFQLGYETLDKLDASSADDTAGANTFLQLIAALPRGLTNAPPTRRPPPPPPPLHPSGKHPLAVLPPERAVLKVRPYANVSGPRKVPVIASANGVPFLRLTKPQPAALSRVLRQKLARRVARFHRKVELDNYWLPLARQEDEWDVLMMAQLMFKEDKVKWTDAVHEAVRQNLALYEGELAQDREIIHKMQRIVDEETELALKEGQEVIRGRRKAPIRVLKP